MPPQGNISLVSPHRGKRRDLAARHPIIAGIHREGIWIRVFRCTGPWHRATAVAEHRSCSDRSLGQRYQAEIRRLPIPVEADGVAAGVAQRIDPSDGPPDDFFDPASAGDNRILTVSGW